MTQPKFFDAIMKYGWANFTHEILYSGLTYEDAMAKEMEMIEKYDSFYNGYNATKGGPGVLGMSNKPIYCPETDTVYDNAREAERILGISYKTISQCCNETINSTHDGYHFRFVDEEELEKNKARRAERGLLQLKVLPAR